MEERLRGIEARLTRLEDHIRQLELERLPVPDRERDGYER